MKIKSFQLQFTEDKLDDIGVVAKILGETKKDFILKAIEERVEKVRGK